MPAARARRKSEVQYTQSLFSDVHKGGGQEKKEGYPSSCNPGPRADEKIHFSWPNNPADRELQGEKKERKEWFCELDRRPVLKPRGRRRLVLRAKDIH